MRLQHAVATMFALLLSLAARAQTTVQIHDIMVAGTNPIVGTAATRTLSYTPYDSVGVSVTGTVAGILNDGGYTNVAYISEPSNLWDNLVLTAEGMPVFNLARLNPACLVVGANATPTLPGTYTYTVTGTDGTLTHTATYTLKVVN